jgi:hypothetical protein
MDDLFKCYDQACEILPACESVLNNIGAQLFRYPLEIKSLLTYLHMVYIIHVTPPRHIILIPIHKVLALTPQCCMLRGDQINKLSEYKTV